MKQNKGIVQGHRARKRFGQNFLCDPMVIEHIVGAIHPQADDQLVEIGPGMGALTAGILSRTDHLHVIEIDRDLIPYLLARFASRDALTIHQQDALTVDFRALSDQLGKPLRVVGNLPYNISTPLIFHLMAQLDAVQDMHFMLQKEVVDRLCAGACDPAYGRLSVMVQYACQVEAVLDVPPEAFDPPPKVNSAIVRLTPFRALPCPAEDTALLQQVVSAAFGQRRKTLRNSLKNLATVEQLDAVNINPSARAETLTLDDFVALTNLLVKARASESH